MRPRYITPIRFAMWRTTARFWLMKRYVRPNLSCRSRIRLRICACTETSSAEVGSSQTINSASEGNCRAIAIPWRSPPEKYVWKFPAVVGMQADQAEQFADARGDVALALDQVEGADRLGHDGVDPK